MEQVNPDAAGNQLNKSIISSYEHIDDESGYCCTKSFTITNRFSRLYKGQDGDIYIFAREHPITEDSVTNNIQLHVFKFVKNSRFAIPPFSDESFKLLEKYEQAAGNIFVSTIDAGLQAEFRNEIKREYNRFKNNATDQQIKKTIEEVKDNLHVPAHKYDKMIDEDAKNI